MNATTYLSPDYSDVCFDYLFDIGKTIPSGMKIRYSMILFAFAGELTIEYDNKNTTVKKGEYVFLKHNTMIAICEKGQFRGAYIEFSKSFLSVFHKNLIKRENQFNSDIFENKIIKLDQTPYTQSLYISLIPYFEWGIKPSDDLLKIKQLEGVYCLLMSDDRFYSCLFDQQSSNEPLGESY